MKIMNKLKAGISFIAFLPSTLYVFSYFSVKKRIDTSFFYTQICMMAKKKPLPQIYFALYMNT